MANRDLGAEGTGLKLSYISRDKLDSSIIEIKNPFSKKIPWVD